MVVRRKPNAATVEEFIEAGSTVPRAQLPTIQGIQQLSERPKQIEIERDEDKTIAVTLRVPDDLLAEVDTTAKKRRPRCSRNSWILEAIFEKLERAKKSD